MTQDLEKLKEWIGQKETDIDYVTIPAVHRLAATLDRDDPMPKFGDALPIGMVRKMLEPKRSGDGMPWGDRWVYVTAWDKFFHLDTAEEIVEATMSVCREAGKTPIRVKDVVGFAVNRVLHQPRLVYFNCRLKWQQLKLSNTIFQMLNRSFMS